MLHCVLTVSPSYYAYDIKVVSNVAHLVLKRFSNDGKPLDPKSSQSQFLFWFSSSSIHSSSSPWGISSGLFILVVGGFIGAHATVEV